MITRPDPYESLPLLARGSSVSAVAAASGYASDSAFSAMFKAAMGQPPSHFQDKKGLLRNSHGRKMLSKP